MTDELDLPYEEEEMVILFSTNSGSVRFFVAFVLRREPVRLTVAQCGAVPTHGAGSDHTRPSPGMRVSILHQLSLPLETPPCWKEKMAT
ncbi:hypothetical protein CDAR_524921 [Caerostris darwini]|uniref:Uncharacterized protein n=1 Tax=Caerostris darwini TaxID=1538125 RepID=A0AAV4QYG5_9ARAC|nr:hypothetical protein CDAR_524921 [Caerostris darwini]